MEKEKILILFDQIGLEETERSQFSNLSLIKVKVKLRQQ